MSNLQKVKVKVKHRGLCVSYGAGFISGYNGMDIGILCRGLFPRLVSQFLFDAWHVYCKLQNVM